MVLHARNRRKHARNRSLAHSHAHLLTHLLAYSLTHSVTHTHLPHSLMPVVGANKSGEAVSGPVRGQHKHTHAVASHSLAHSLPTLCSSLHVCRCKRVCRSCLLAGQRTTKTSPLSSAARQQTSSQGWWKMRKPRAQHSLHHSSGEYSLLHTAFWPPAAFRSLSQGAALLCRSFCRSCVLKGCKSGICLRLS